MATIIKLDCKALQVKGREFTIEHAQALLKLETEMGLSNWVINPGSDYIFKDGIINRTDKGADKKSGKSFGN